MLSHDAGERARVDAIAKRSVKAETSLGAESPAPKRGARHGQLLRNEVVEVGPGGLNNPPLAGNRPDTRLWRRTRVVAARAGAYLVIQLSKISSPKGSYAALGKVIGSVDCSGCCGVTGAGSAGSKELVSRATVLSAKDSGYSATVGVPD
jgi:hypothetical protein